MRPYRLLWLLTLASCVPELDIEPDVQQSRATIAIFAPDADDPCASVLPFPSDLAKDPTTGRLNVPYCVDDGADTVAMKTGLRTLDGYAVGGTLYTDFSGPIDGGSVDGSVHVINAATGSRVDSTAFFDPTANRLYIQPTTLLAERTRYLVAVTSRLRDTSGAPLASDQVFTFLKSRTALIDAAGYSRYPALTDDQANGLEPLREAYRDLFDAFADLGITRDEVLVAWSFTTQTAYAAMPFLGIVASTSAPVVTHHTALRAHEHPLLAAAGIPTSALCNLHTGTITLTSLLSDSGTFAAGAGGAPFTRRLAVDYLLTTPQGAADCSQPYADDPSEPWDFTRTVVFAHGLGRCKNDALALANTLASVGFATLALDGPRAGSRSVQALGDQDLDGCPDQPETPELVALVGQSPNPFAIRDGLRGWALDLVQAAAVATDMPWQLAGEPQPAPIGNPQVALVGHSFGGMAAALAGAVSSDVDLVAMMAASAGLGDMFAPLLVDGLTAALIAAGIDVNTPAGAAILAEQVAQTVPVFAWVMEPGDPLFAASAYPAQLTKPVLIQVVTSDGMLSDAPLHAAASQERLASTFGRQALIDVTFPFVCFCDESSTLCPAAGGVFALCDSPESVVGGMLAPCVEDTASLEYGLALGRLSDMQTQLVVFLASGAAPPADPVAICP